MDMKLLHDVHLGVERAAGTTPESAEALRQFSLDMFEEEVQSTDDTLLILGDLFDSHTVSHSVLLRTFNILSRHCRAGPALLLVPGNHDLHTDSAKLSSFQLLAQLLEDAHPKVVTYISEGTRLDYSDYYVIPHMPNQELFEAELARVPECEWLLVHCNFDNNFAKQKDHSLNMSREQAHACKAKRIYFAHEHNHRTAMGDKVYVGGVQYPTSISDCVDKGPKYTHSLQGDKLSKNTSWQGGYEECDWRDEPLANRQFVRFTGQCLPEEAVAMTDAIARVRNEHKAYVIGNAVQVLMQDEDGKAYTTSLESLQGFDLMRALSEILSKGDMEMLEKLK